MRPANTTRHNPLLLLLQQKVCVFDSQVGEKEPSADHPGEPLTNSNEPWEGLSRETHSIVYVNGVSKGGTISSFHSSAGLSTVPRKIACGPDLGE